MLRLLLVLSFLLIILGKLCFPEAHYAFQINVVVFSIISLFSAIVCCRAFRQINLLILLFNLVNYIIYTLIYSVMISYNKYTFIGPFSFEYMTPDSLSELFYLMTIIMGTNQFIFLLPKTMRTNSKFLIDRIIRLATEKYGRILSDNKIYKIIGGFILVSFAIFLVTGNIFAISYPFNVHAGLVDIPSMIRALIVLGMISFYILFLAKHRFKISLQSIAIKASIYLSVFLIILCMGSRGSAVGLLVFVFLFEMIVLKTSLLKLVLIVLDAFLVFFIIIFWPTIRVNTAIMGFWEAIQSSIYIATNYGSGFDKIFLKVPMFPMSVFHFLYVIFLVNSGDSLNWVSFINIIPQQLPSILDGILWVRPGNDNMLLMDRIFHGGGFYIYANAYWNGGVLPLMVFTVISSYMLVAVEVVSKKRTEYLLAYPIFLFMIPINMLYGIQGMVRAFEHGFVLILIIRLFRKSRRAVDSKRLIQVSD